MLWQMLKCFPQKGQTDDVDDGECEDETFCIHHRFQSLFFILIFISTAYGLLGKGRKIFMSHHFFKVILLKHNAHQSVSLRIQKSFLMSCRMSNWELIKNSYFCKTLSLSHSKRHQKLKLSVEKRENCATMCEKK